MSETLYKTRAKIFICSLIVRLKNMKLRTILIFLKIIWKKFKKLITHLMITTLYQKMNNNHNNNNKKNNNNKYSNKK